MKPDFKLLKQVLNLPTAPFHEHHVARFVLHFCKSLGLSCKQDSFGNLKVIYRHGASKPVAFTAHMDHPGFEVLKGGKKSLVQLLGGVPDNYFLKSKVVLCDNKGFAKGKVIQVADKKRRQFWVQVDRSVEKKGFGYFNLPGFKLRKGLIKTKAADNVMSVGVLLNFLKELKRKKIKAHVICIFTRAEEVGFVGASGLVKNNFLSKKIPAVVLETSSAKAGGVAIGGGPVLRVGDRFSTFAPEMDVWLKTAADSLQSKDKSFRYQRALLPGGRCEASLYVAEGYRVGGLAFPLGNYHNKGPKNYAAEFISAKDYQDMLKWLIALAQASLPSKLSKKLYKGIDKIFRRYSSRLEKISG